MASLAAFRYSLSLFCVSRSDTSIWDGSLDCDYTIFGALLGTESSARVGAPGRFVEPPFKTLYGHRFSEKLRHIPSPYPPQYSWVALGYGVSTQIANCVIEH